MSEISSTQDDYKIGRAIYFFRLTLTKALEQHAFVYVDHIKSQKPTQMYHQHIVQYYILQNIHG